MKIRNRLADILKERGISNRELARMTGYSHEPIRTFANNEAQRYSIRLIETLCEALHLDLFDLIYDAENESSAADKVTNHTDV